MHYCWVAREWVRVALVDIHDAWFEARRRFFALRALAIHRRETRKTALRPADVHDIYRCLMASGEYTWRQFGTRRKARQAARRAAKWAWSNWREAWSNYLRYLPGVRA